MSKESGTVYLKREKKTLKKVLSSLLALTGKTSDSKHEQKQLLVE